MQFFSEAVNVLQTLVIALGAGLRSGALSTFWKATATITPVQNRRVSSSLWQAAVSC